MKLYRTNVDVACKIQKVGSFKKAVADYLPIIRNENKVIKPSPSWQPDLTYVSSILVSEGRNDNGDGFLRSKLVEAWDTPQNKFVDYEHDPDGLNERGTNPTKYQIVGHIYESVLTLQRNGSIIPASRIYKDFDDVWFQVDSEWRNEPLDITVAWVLYKFQFPELAELLERRTTEDPEKFGVSMEVLFSDYKYRVGDFDATEAFEYDATLDGKIEAKKDTPLGNILGEFWKNKIPYNGKPITRILGGLMFFSGMAITQNRANRRSVNLAIASNIENEIGKLNVDKEESELTKLIKQVASKSNFDTSACEMVNGEPTCDCIYSAIENEIASLNTSLAELTDMAEAIKKRKDVNPKEGESKYGDVKFADEKNKKYPIDTEEHIRAAWNYINKKHNSGKYESGDVSSIKSKIVSAWKKHIDKDGPPSAKGNVGPEDFNTETHADKISEKSAEMGLFENRYNVGLNSTDQWEECVLDNIQKSAVTLCQQVSSFVPVRSEMDPDELNGIIVGLEKFITNSSKELEKIDKKDV